jgi:hypothetical protein
MKERGELGFTKETEIKVLGVAGLIELVSGLAKIATAQNHSSDITLGAAVLIGGIITLLVTDNIIERNLQKPAN